MAKKSKFTVPYRKSDGYVPRGSWDLDDVERNPENYEICEPKIFEETMTIIGVGGVSTMKSSSGVVYDMFASELFDMIGRTTLFHGVVSGRWTHVKRCYTFGLKYLGPIT